MTATSSFAPPGAAQVAADVEHALAEDLGQGDATAALLPADAQARARLTCRDAAVIAGSAWFDACFRRLDPAVQIDWRVRDGDRVAADTLVCELAGHARSLVTAERTALNFLQLLSATATTTADHVAAVAGTAVRVLDTRKTVPGLRVAQKYAVRCGGARNHRLGLHDMVLIKENHIIAAGSISRAIETARRTSPGIPVEVEVETLDEFDQALAAGADIILLDELGNPDMREAVARNRAHESRGGSKARLEASGSVNMTTVREIALTGVDYNSIGSITKHVQAVDLSLRIEFAQ